MDDPGVDPGHPTGAVSSRLRMLGWFYLGLGLAILLWSSFILLLFLFQFRDPKGAPIPVFILGLGFFSAWGGWSLLKGQRYTLCAMMAGASLICFPVGSILGYFTLQELLEPDTQAAFRVPSRPGLRTPYLALMGAILFIATALVTLFLDGARLRSSP